MTPSTDRRATADTGDRFTPEDRAVAAGWANVLSDMLVRSGYTTPGGEPNPEAATHTKGGPIPYDARTIRRWLNADVKVSGDAIRDTCRAFGANPVRAALRAGWYLPDEVGVSALPPDKPKPRRLHRLAEWVDVILTNSAVPSMISEAVEAAVRGIKIVVEASQPPAPVEPHGLARRPGDVKRR